MNKGFAESLRRVDELIRRVMEVSSFPGLSIGITDRKRTIWTRAYGYSELESKQKVKTSTLFEIGSISKFFSSTALMQLRDEGLVDVDVPVTDYLPWFKVRTRFGPITLHHLLSHTAGLIIGQEESPEGVPEVWMLRDTETGAAPGERFYYSNHGYKTVGLVIEKITGQPVGQVVKSRVLDPLGMAATDPVIANETRLKLAVGYEPFFNDRPFVPGGRLAPATWFESGTADGTICSTPGDMCKYLRMLLNGGRGPHGRLVSVEGFELMTSPHIKPEDGFHGESYGYGMNVGKVEGHSCLWHTGGMVGYHASIIADLDAGLGIVVLVNGPGLPEEVSMSVLRTILAGTEGRRLPSVSVKRVKDVEKPEQYAGEYSSRGNRVSIKAKGKSLWLLHGRRRDMLVPVGPDKFYSSADDYDRFLMRFGREDGVVVELFHGPEWYTNSKYRGSMDFARKPDWEALTGHYHSNSAWSSGFRIVLRKGLLALIETYGEEEPLTPLKDGAFRIGADPRSPERVRFDMFVEGKPHMAIRSAGRYYRSFLP